MDQGKVFNDLGKSLIANAWKGFNASLFAYGQTGSGKSYSIFGYGVNKGLVPMFADAIFKDIDGKKGTGVTFEMTFSMLEIYNENVRDLLVSNGKKSTLKVRQHPKRGFYGRTSDLQTFYLINFLFPADGLKEVIVTTYEDISKRMEEGNVNRTIASTNMNATSSRAHTIVGIKFTQKSKNEAGKEMEKRSLINIVDLAGSERADSTGATGDRLKEGANINLSLSTLGNVIAALADGKVS